MRMPIELLFPALLACSSAPSDPASPAAPTSCDPLTRSGTYLFHYVTVSGNCGPIADALINLGAASMQSAQNGCTLAASTLSDGQCKLEDVLECPGNVTFTEVSTEQNSAGSVITGEASVSSPSCAGTYDLTATRQ
jgi:hypothetical protein